MKCENCGNEYPPGGRFCASCGAQVRETPANHKSAPNIPAPPTNYGSGGYIPDASREYRSKTRPPEAPAGYGRQTPSQEPPAGYGRQQAPSQEPPTGYGRQAPSRGAPAGYADQQPAQGAPASYDPYSPTDDTERSTLGVFSSIKALPLKRILMIAIPIIVVIAAVLIALPLLSGPNTYMVRDCIYLFSGNSEVLISGNNNARFTIDGDLYSEQFSIDGSKAALLTDYSLSLGGTLWFVTTSGSIRIADNVLAFCIADTGNAIAYLSDFDSRADLATLYLYDTSANKETRITEDAMFVGYGEMSGVCISPDGKSVGYISDYDSRYGEFTGYIKVDGKAAEALGDNTLVLAVSDGGKHVYYIKESNDGYIGSLYVRSGKNETRLIPDLTSSIPLLLNRDYSQVVYEVDGRSYFCQSGGERERISGAAIQDFLLPRGTQIWHSENYMSITVYGVKSLKNQIAVSDEGLVHLNNNLEINKIPSSSDSRYRTVYSNNTGDLFTTHGAAISSDGKTLIYINNNGHLSTIDPSNPNAERHEIAKHVDTFAATNDGKIVYYVNNDDELWCAKGNKEPVKISDDVSNRYLVLPLNSNKAFFLADYSSTRGGELYYSTNGGKRTKVSGGNDIMEIWSTPANLFYISYDKELFRSNGSEKFTLFADDVNYHS